MIPTLYHNLTIALLQKDLIFMSKTNFLVKKWYGQESMSFWMADQNKTKKILLLNSDNKAVTWQLEEGNVVRQQSWNSNWCEINVIGLIGCLFCSINIIKGGQSLFQCNSHTECRLSLHNHTVMRLYMLTGKER